MWDGISSATPCENITFRNLFIRDFLQRLTMTGADRGRRPLVGPSRDNDG